MGRFFRNAIRQGNDMGHLIELRDRTAPNPYRRLREPVNFTLDKGEHLAVIGPNGAGKSIFIDMLSGSADIRQIKFRDAFSLTGSAFYHQQRWNSQDADSAPSVREVLDRTCGSLPGGNAGKADMTEHIFRLLEIGPMLDSKTVMLSSGELRKLQLAAALASCPEILIIDNPYIGLDVSARQTMDSMLSDLAADGHVRIILVVNKTGDIPPFITHVLTVNDMAVGRKVPAPEFRAAEKESVRSGKAAGRLSPGKRRAILELPYSGHDYNASVVADLRNVSIRYGGRTILDRLDWKILNGEKWALCGENGSGKSTLLSLICADNPQSYACDITLFDRKRGSGESIWDIKRHIGYASPEMYRAFLLHIPAIGIVAGGLSDTAGICGKPTEEQLSISSFWMDIFGIGQLRNRFFTDLSSGEQHLCLLARAFVKDPELLILDEPLHCLDDRNRELAKEIIATFCLRRNKTLIMVSHYEENFPDIMDHRLTLSRH